MRRLMTRSGCVMAALVILTLMTAVPAHAQIRGLYAPGIFATNSGTLPEQGVTYMTIFQLFSFDELKGPRGADLPVSLASSVVAGHNVFMWVTNHKVFG